LKDKFGVSWQIVPAVLGELLSSRDAAKSERVMQAMLKMVKLDIKKLKQASKWKTPGLHLDSQPNPGTSMISRTVNP
jgi:hypothetical protein